MKIKTSELTGPALDWAVAKAEGLKPHAMVERDYGQAAHRPLNRWAAINLTPVGHDVFSPSTDWAQGGPIIEREQIHTYFDPECMWADVPAPAVWVAWINCGGMRRWHGRTLLIAAMRCFVASRLGDEVGVPKELLKDD